jgi:hypothetical protein
VAKKLDMLLRWRPEKESAKHAPHADTCAPAHALGTQAPANAGPHGQTEAHTVLQTWCHRHSITDIVATDIVSLAYLMRSLRVSPLFKAVLNARIKVQKAAQQHQTLPQPPILPAGLTHVCQRRQQTRVSPTLMHLY